AQGGEVEALELGMLELGNEHRGHAAEGGAALVRHRLEHGTRIDPLPGHDDARPVRDAGERPEHHAEAVIERHGHARGICLAVVERARREVRAVEWALVSVEYACFVMLWWVSVAPLGKPVVPDVYWMLMASSNCSQDSRSASSSSPTRSLAARNSSQSSSSTIALRSSGQVPRTSASMPT